MEIRMVTKKEVYSPLPPRGLCFFILFTKSVKSHHPRIKLAGVVERDLWEFHSGGLHKRCIKGFIEFISTPRSSSFTLLSVMVWPSKKEVDPLCQYTWTLFFCQKLKTFWRGQQHFSLASAIPTQPLFALASFQSISAFFLAICNVLNMKYPNQIVGEVFYLESGDLLDCCMRHEWHLLMLY